MSPVRQSTTRSPRALVLAVGGAALGVILVIVLFIVAIPSLTESGKVQVKLGDDTYSPGSAESKAETIADGGPILLGDVSGRNERDIYLQHLGDDPTTGWYAFDARRPGQPRDCFLRWEAGPAEFVDSCDGTVVAADGAGLIAYQVTVDDDGAVVIDLNADRSSDTTGG
jgi:hypothetical protein